MDDHEDVKTAAGDGVVHVIWQSFEEKISDEVDGTLIVYSNCAEILALILQR